MPFGKSKSGTPAGDVRRQLGFAEQTFYAWKKKYAHLGVSELRRLRQVEEENARLNRLVADLSLCRLAQSSRAAWYRRSRAKDQSALRLRIRDVAQARPRFGYQRI